MKKLLLLLIIPFLSFGQGWEQTYSDLYGWKIKQTSDGGYIIIGDGDIGGSGYLGALIKLNNLGVIEWVNEDISGKSVQETIGGGYIVCGHGVEGIEASGEGNICLTKTDGYGNHQWSQCYSPGDNGGEGADDVQQTSDGGYIICGFFNNHYLSGSTDSDLVIIKTNYNGDEEWLEKYDYGNNLYNFGNTIKIVEDGYVVAGGGGCEGGGYLMKVNDSGQEQWAQCHDISGPWNESRSLAQTVDGGYLIAGINGGEPLKVIKTDGNGNEDWSGNFNILGLAGALSIENTIDGGYIICGQTFQVNEDSTDEDWNGLMYLLKLDENFEEEWHQLYGEQLDTSFGVSCQQTIDGGYVLLGYGYNFYPNYEESQTMILIKTNEFGNITSTVELPSIKKNLITTLDILGRETNNKEGFQLHIYDDGSVEKKYLLK